VIGLQAGLAEKAIFQQPVSPPSMSRLLKCIGLIYQANANSQIAQQEKEITYKCDKVKITVKIWEVV